MLLKYYYFTYNSYDNLYLIFQLLVNNSMNLWILVIIMIMIISMISLPIFSSQNASPGFIQLTRQIDVLCDASEDYLKNKEPCDKLYKKLSDKIEPFCFGEQDFNANQEQCTKLFSLANYIIPLCGSSQNYGANKVKCDELYQNVNHVLRGYEDTLPILGIIAIIIIIIVVIIALWFLKFRKKSSSDGDIIDVK